MATEVAPIQTTAPKRRWRPRLRYGLGGLLLLVTLCAVGLWYWFRVPVLEEQYGIHSNYFSSSVPPAKTNYLRERGYGLRKLGGDKVRHGVWTTYYENGNKESEAEYREGLLHGTERHWSKNGQIISEVNSRFGKRHGEFKRWTADGTLAFAGSYDNGLPTGNWQWRKRYYLANSTDGLSRFDYEAVRGAWKDGVPHGLWRGVDAAGEVQFAMEWNDGRLVSSSLPYDKRAAELIRTRAIEDPDVVTSLMEPIGVTFSNAYLMQIINFVGQEANFPLRWHAWGPIALPAGPPASPPDRIALTDDSELLIPTDERAAPYEIDWRMRDQSQQPAPPKEVELSDLRVSFSAWNVPTIIVLGQLLEPYGLACDYRYGMLTVVHEETIANWKDPTWVTALQPQPGTRLHEEWSKPSTVEFVETPLVQAMDFIAANHQIKIDVSRLPASVRSQPVTMNLKGISLKNCIGAILEQQQCQCRLESGKLSIEPHGYRR